jgi:hypothetical protein
VPAMPVSPESIGGAGAAGAVLAGAAVVALWLIPPPPPLEQAVEKAQHSAASTTIFEVYDLRIKPPYPIGIRWPQCRETLRDRRVNHADINP